MTKSECSIKQGNNVVRFFAPFGVFNGFRFVRVICGRFLIKKITFPLVNLTKSK
jgi:hypothetical protein